PPVSVVEQQLLPWPYPSRRDERSARCRCHSSAPADLDEASVEVGSSAAVVDVPRESPPQPRTSFTCHPLFCLTVRHLRRIHTPPLPPPLKVQHVGPRVDGTSTVLSQPLSTHHITQHLTRVLTHQRTTR